MKRKLKNSWTHESVTTNTLAWSIRAELGQLLNPDSHYESPRVKEIAIRMDELNREWDKLDQELHSIAIASGYVEEEYQSCNEN